MGFDLDFFARSVPGRNKLLLDKTLGLRAMWRIRIESAKAHHATLDRLQMLRRD